MEISAKAWKDYISKMSAISQTAADLMEAYIQKNGYTDDKRMLEFAKALSDKYGEAIGALSCEMYEATAAASGVVIAPAEIADTPTYKDVAMAIFGARKVSPALISQAMYRLTKQTGADTTLKNAARDGAQFAWIPSGDTCAFCIALASRGWQYTSKENIKGGHAEHIHANCDCQYGVRFDNKSGVRGYKPEKYLEMYNKADPNGNSQDKINAMRRAAYANKKDYINEQKRKAYAIRNGKSEE